MNGPFTLVGVTCIGGYAEGSAFLIPFFKCHTSNRHFAQELDTDRRIAAFREFEPFKYTVIQKGLPAKEKEIGDVGIMALRRGAELWVADAPELIERLTNLKLKKEKSPFFEIDACQLSGRESELPGAIRRASKALGRHGMAESWARAELRIARRTPLSADPDWPDQELQWLVDHPEDRRWAVRWSELWRRHPNRDALMELGAVFAESRQPVAQRGRVISMLISTRQFHQHTLVVNAAERWLEDAIRLTPGEPSVGRVWIALANGGAPVRGRFFDYGVKHCEAASFSSSPAAGWPSVWSWLWKAAPAEAEPGRDFLTHIASFTLVQKSENARATKLAVKALKSASGWPQADNTLFEWVRSTRVHSNAWIDALLAVMPTHPSDDLLDQAIAWLGTEPGKLRRWVEVFEAVLAQGPPEYELRMIGNDWLKRADPAMTTWPQVAHRVLQMGPDDIVERLVNSWIADRPDQPMAWSLSLILTEVEERRQALNAPNEEPAEPRPMRLT